MIKIGMLIGDRYEILEKIGTGGMSDVYKAKCHKLNRFVAVKVLKQEFSENANFVSKFKIEAQAAAGLMHPNIVNVYDVGDDRGIYYIVMELVEGITLKKYIEKKARLSVKEAISIAIQISMGIEAAHNNHIIHRDIKPQNIIISKDGKVKVTDFGIAKAATSNTITSNVMGSVHYTSPEQARGGFSDEKSDIYSLGITLYEMLTGRVPFNGETTVAIAIKHIQEKMPTPRDYVSEIPISVEQIVLKCTQKSPDRRYLTMGELIEDLKKSLMNPDEDFVIKRDPDAEASTRMITEIDMQQIKKQSQKREPAEDPTRMKKKQQEEKVVPKKKKVVRPVEIVEEPEDDDYNPKMEKVTTILAIIAAILIGLIVIFLVGRAVGVFNFGTPGGTESSQTITMIDVEGKEIGAASSELMTLGFQVKTTYEESDSVEQNVVISSDIAPGTKVAANTTVLLTVSSGTDGVTVPNVTNLSLAEAVANLEKDGFVVNQSENPSNDIAKGNIISQSPEAGEKAPRGSAVSILVSKGSEGSKVLVPDVTKLSETDATVTLAEAGLTVGTVSQTTNADASLLNLVCYQSVAAGSYVDAKTKVDIQVSVGVGTYSFVGSVASPGEEDSEYQAGTPTTVILTTASGVELYRVDNITAFPLNINITGGIQGEETGILTFIFNVSTGGSTTTDPVTGETVITQGTSVEKKVQRVVKFAKES